MSDYTPYTRKLYTPTIEEVLKASTGRTPPLSDAHFYRWLVAHEEEIRADEREQAAQRVSVAIGDNGTLFHPNKKGKAVAWWIRLVDEVRYGSATADRGEEKNENPTP